MKRPQILAVVSVGYVQIFLKKLSFNRSSRPEVFLGKGVLKISSKFIGDIHAECDFNKVAKQLY